MNFLSAGWIWLYIGGFLMLAELLAPGFVVFFFGLAAATVGLLVMAVPESFHIGLAWQLALFSFFCVIYLVTLRRAAGTLLETAGAVRVGDVSEKKFVKSNTQKFGDFDDILVQYPRLSILQGGDGNPGQSDSIGDLFFCKAKLFTCAGYVFPHSFLVHTDGKISPYSPDGG